MRYRNRIRLAPGVNINLSKSGISTSIGPKGANINIGKSGTYLNSGIPGTGLYNRTKISNSKHQGTENQAINKSQVGVKLDLNEHYQPIIEIFDNKSNNITNQQLINKVKRTPEYKEYLKKIYQIYYDNIIHETEDFISLYKNTLLPITKEEVAEQLNNLKPKEYKKEEFPISKPTHESVKMVLASEATNKFNSILFWKNRKKRKEYIEEHLDDKLKEATQIWLIKKQEYDKDQCILEKVKNQEYQQAYELEKKLLKSNINGNEEFVVQNFANILNEIDIIPEFHIDFEYKENEKSFYLDLDLPEIEDIPIKTASILSSGKLSVKNKSLKQVREEYATCVTGLAFLVTGIAFMAASGIEIVTISAYTQRIDGMDGKTKDDYIYNIIFDRDNFSKLNFKNIDPIKAFENFNNKMRLSKIFNFESININETISGY